jgi:hypothetical protein
MADLIERDAMTKTHVSLPGVVDAYDPVLQTVDVTPSIKVPLLLSDGSVEWQTLPKIPSVPVRFPRTATYVFYIPIEKGDRVNLIVSDYDLSVWWKSTAGMPPVAPGLINNHDLAGAVAEIGLYPMTQPLVGANLGSTILIGKDASAVATGDFVAWAGKVLTELGKIETAFNNHTHPIAAQATTCPAGAGTCTGVTGAGPAYTKASVACSDVKVT